MGRLVWKSLVATLALFAGTSIFFGPVQWILADPRFQSAKMLEAFTGTPPPRMMEAPWIVLPIGFLLVGTGIALAHGLVRAALSGSRWAQGRKFGLVVWLAAIPWFEFYLPYNVLREPLGLALLEAVCWLLTMQLVGHAVVWADAMRRAKAA